MSRLFRIFLIILIGVSMALYDVDKNSEDRGTPTPNVADVPSANQDKQMSFTNTTGHSNVLRIVYTGTFSVPGLYTGTKTYAHGLGYIPAFQAYVFVSSDTHYYQVPWLLIDSGTGATQALVSASADTTNFYVNVTEIVGLQPLTIKFYLLQTSAN